MLNTPQVEQYASDGYVFLDGYYSPDEIRLIRGALQPVVQHRGERTVLEADSAIVRSVYGVHQSDDFLGRLARHSSLAQLAQQLLGGRVYVYQSKLNIKAAFDGGVWDWHQDFIYWRREDGVQSPAVLTIAVFVDDVTEFNGPLIVIPQSHRHGSLESSSFDGKPAGYENSPSWISNLTAKIKYPVDRTKVSELAQRHGMVAPKGRAGSVLIFDGNIVHASQPNISPDSRRLLLYTYNRADNAPALEGLHRPDFLVSRDVQPLTVIQGALGSLTSLSAAE